MLDQELGGTCVFVPTGVGVAAVVVVAISPRSPAQADFQTSRVILETERKREALYECIQGLRKPEARLRVTVNRGLLVDTAVQQIMNAPREHLVRRFDVKFHGEPGIDAGGLTWCVA